MWGGLFIRLIGAIVIGIAGWRLGSFIAGQNPERGELAWVLPFAIGGFVLGFFAAPYITRPWHWARRRIRQIPAHSFLAAIIGLVIALMSSALLALPLSLLPGSWGKAVPPIVALFLSYLFISVMVLRGRDILQFFSVTPALRAPPLEGRDEQIILDTNAIIDGRIADIIQTGFIRGTLLIPRFVLDELRHTADSSEWTTGSRLRLRGAFGVNCATCSRTAARPVQTESVSSGGSCGIWSGCGSFFACFRSRFSSFFFFLASSF